MFKHIPLKPCLLFFSIFILLTGGCALDNPDSGSPDKTSGNGSGSSPFAVVESDNNASGTVVPVIVSKLSGFAGTGITPTDKNLSKPSLQAPVSSGPGDFAFAAVDIFSLTGTIIASGSTDDAGAFSLDVPVGQNYLVKVTSGNGLSEVIAYLASVGGEGISDVAIDALSSSVVYALEQYVEIPDIFMGYTGIAKISSVVEQILVHSRIQDLSVLVQADILAGNSQGLTQGTLDFLAVNFTNTPPVVQISEPLDGTYFSECEVVSFRAAAHDVEDGNLFGPSLVWSSDQSGVLGEGGLVVTSSLPPGVHTISVTASDIGAKASTTFITLTITASAGGWCSASAGGLHSLAIKGDETLWAWGLFGILNNGTPVFLDYPVQIGTDTDWRLVTTSDSASFAIKMDGSLWTWGEANNFSVAPSRFDDSNDWLTISAGLRHHVGRRLDGSLWTWGDNSFGQLGDGTTIHRSQPVMVGFGRDWVQVSAGFEHTAGLKTNGSLWTWGSNSSGQLGNGTNIPTNFPVRVGNGLDWVSVSSSGQHTLALKGDGSIWGWGQDNYCQLGIGCAGNRNFPVRVGMDTDWVAVFAGPSDSFAIKSDGTLWGWGKNNFGELGDVSGFNMPGRTSIIAPGQIGTDTDWAQVYSGRYHTVAIKSDGTMLSWGRNQ